MNGISERPHERLQQTCVSICVPFKLGMALRADVRLSVLSAKVKSFKSPRFESRQVLIRRKGTVSCLPERFPFLLINVGRYGFPCDSTLSGRLNFFTCEIDSTSKGTTQIGFIQGGIFFSLSAIFFSASGISFSFVPGRPCYSLCLCLF